jgi:hypothetical protein
VINRCRQYDVFLQQETRGRHGDLQSLVPIKGEASHRLLFDALKRPRIGQVYIGAWRVLHEEEDQQEEEGKVEEKVEQKVEKNGEQKVEEKVGEKVEEKVEEKIEKEKELKQPTTTPMEQQRQQQREQHHARVPHTVNGDCGVLYLNTSVIIGTFDQGSVFQGTPTVNRY